MTFTGMLFQPVPWSMQTKKGMPADFEKYAADAEYVIINTPPNFMFQVRIIICQSAMAPSSMLLRLQFVPQACCSMSAHAMYMLSRLALCWNGYQGGVLLTHAGKDLQAFPALRNLQEKVKGLALSSLCAWQSESYGVQYCLPLHSSART